MSDAQIISTCPIGMDTTCDLNYFWNDLACECFSVRTCFAKCPEGESLNPTQKCECDLDSVIASLYPQDATEEEIQAAYDRGYEAYYVENDMKDISEMPIMCGGDKDDDKGGRRLCINPSVYNDLKEKAIASGILVESGAQTLTEFLFATASALALIY